MSHLKRGLGGHLISNAAGHLVHTCEEIPPEPCDVCCEEVEQPNVEFSVTPPGNPGGLCDLAALNPLTFSICLGYADFCEWGWARSGYVPLRVRYYPSTGVWTAQLYWHSTGGSTFIYGGYDEDCFGVITGVSCDPETGLLSGGFSLPGLGLPCTLQDCSHKTANFTIG